MKKLISKIRNYFHSVVERIEKKLIRPFVIRWYKFIMRDHYRDFVLSIKEVNIKKGKKRFTLLIIQTKEGKIKVDLGRHKVLTHGYLHLNSSYVAI